MEQPPVGYDKRLDMSGIMGRVDVTTGADLLARPGQRIVLVDFLDQKWVDVLAGIDQWVVVTWTGQKITTLVYNVQNVTSAWLLVLAFNGLSHPMQLQHGMQLRIPTRASLEAILRRMNAASGVGKTVTI
jgi:hypothetical protein